jgi:hypothetical protein
VKWADSKVTTPDQGPTITLADLAQLEATVGRTIQERDAAIAETARIRRDLEAELAASQAALLLAQAAHDALLNSTTWRATRPLRKAAAAMPLVVRHSLRQVMLDIYRLTILQFNRLVERRQAARSTFNDPDQHLCAPVIAPSEATVSPLPVLAPEVLEKIQEHLERLQARTEALEPTLGRLDALERDLTQIQLLGSFERDRLDWALGAIAGMEPEIGKFHAAQETVEYRAAFETSAPRVSVCVATMDRANLLLERCIPSLVAQTYRNLEIIVVGDNCTDDTANRLAAVGDERIRFHNLKERGPYPSPGLDRWCVAGSAAMNHALSMCNGDFITHIDDDDAMVPQRIEILVASALDSKADFLWHPLLWQNSDGTFQRLGNGRLEIGQVGTGSIFYHRYFARFPWDVLAYRLGEPGDWNRIRRIKMLRPRLLYVDEPLACHYLEQHAPFVPREGERFLK